MAEVTPKIVALSEVNHTDGRELFDFLIGESEQVLLSYKSIRDRLVVTNKKLLIIDVQGITGKKKEYMVIPYSKISAFSCESAGSFDLDAELKIWASGINKVEFEFTRNTDIKPLVAILNKYIC